MSGRLFDPHTSRAVLIGVSRYSRLPALPPVGRSLYEMASVLTDSGVCRLPARHCAVVRDPSDGNAVGGAVGRAAAEATDMLLVYYAGHGLGGLRRGQLFLALGETDPERPAFHSLAYDVLREEVLDSPAKSRVVILDCCFSGRAASPIMATETSVILGQLDIAGAYVLTASPANQPAIAGAEITEFTSELVQALRRGVPGAPPLLTLDVLYAHLRRRMEARNLPQPRRLHTDAAGRLALASNPLHRMIIDDVDPLREKGAPLPEVDPSNAAPAAFLVTAVRRSQVLVDRLIGHLDRLERVEEDPDRLSELFAIDHLATRMRRYCDGVLVLADENSMRVRHQPAALLDVLRAAQSEVEQYTRIRLVNIDHDIEIAAHAINDLVHLFAELLDNATTFSPPHSEVVVKARRLRNGVALDIVDRGIGIGPESLTKINERLAAPPDFGVAATPGRLGLLVVAILAARCGVKVELRPALEGGIVADVLLPSTIAGRKPPTIAHTSSASRFVAGAAHTGWDRARVPGPLSEETVEIPKIAR